VTHRTHPTSAEPPTPPTPGLGGEPGLTHNLITLLVLKSNHPDPWSRAEIEVALNDIPAWDINDALAELEDEGVVILNGEQVEASRCARYIDSIETIRI
jgi:hypothetical protein